MSENVEMNLRHTHASPPLLKLFKWITWKATDELRRAGLSPVGSKLVQEFSMQESEGRRFIFCDC